MSNWNIQDIPNLTGKVVVVTGGNSGLGFQTSKISALKGAHVVIASRDMTRGEEARNSIISEYPKSTIEVIQLDLSDLNSVENFASQIINKYNRLDYLFNNAGVIGLPYRLTKSGFEMQLGVNHFGHFALTGQLLDLLKNTKGSRVINVSSNSHKKGTIDFDDLEMKRNYGRFKAYQRSKLANLLFSYELQRRFDNNNIMSKSIAAHPGRSFSNMPFQKGGFANNPIFKIIIFILFKLTSQTTEQGTLPQLYAAYSKKSEGGKYYGPDGRNERKGYPQETKSIPITYDKIVAKKLWEISEELTGVKYDF